jgi:hypothetical protein
VIQSISAAGVAFGGVDGSGTADGPCALRPIGVDTGLSVGLVPHPVTASAILSNPTTSHLCMLVHLCSRHFDDPFPGFVSPT